MTIRVMSSRDLLSLNKFTIDDGHPHIELDKAICVQCVQKPCLLVCPAELYTRDENGGVFLDTIGCLECGTCRILCPNGGIIHWEYPRGKFGVQYHKG
ncbi:4Fe-4S dicluster domain-containing protein [Dehalobacter sp. DCM]|uniref:ferredoxin family protein n=1 Tax=Dehalobacter sp. DCM TaxID=2907827 RepID=UPI00308198CC|nr:4Fe-4S dicluster domain-containing protein [Dehalobacter sp. DCM]